MTDYDDLMRNFATAAAQDLKPLVRAATSELGADEAKVGFFLAKAWMAGAQAGQAEMVAQAIEQGANVENEMIRPSRENA